MRTAQQRLHRGRHLQRVKRFFKTIGAPLPDQHPVSTRVRTLSSRKKGLPCVRAIKIGRESPQPGIVPQQGLEQYVRTRLREGVELELACSTFYCPNHADTPDGS